MKKLILLLFFMQLGVVSMAQDLYRNMNAPIHERIQDLLSKLTLEEKVSLLRATSPGVERLGIEKYYMGNEALHGIVRPGKFTVFPQAIGLASMWNPALQQEIATVVSDEARARWNELEQGKKQKDQFSDLLTFWSPTVNMARDPRWGRTPETYGEDPFLSGVLGAAYVKGLQGDHPRYLKTVATPKHFAANNEEHNRFECNAIISETNLREYYFPAFEKCIREGKAESIMTSYTAINGVPSTANDWLLKKVLREDWGFGGYVVSDCGGVACIMTDHHFVKMAETAATLAIKAGLDLECGDNIFAAPLLNAHKQYMVSTAEIDSAAYHILRARMRLGLFDDPAKNPYNQLSPTIVGCKKHQELALESSRQSIVLLKNKKNTLPLNPKKIQSIAVVGINAANYEFGDYSGSPVNAPVSVLEGIRNRVGNQVKVVHAPWTSSEEGYQLIASANFPKGLNAEYFDNPTFSGTPKTRVDKGINFEPKNQAPDPFLPKSPLSIRWTGELVPNASGEYIFSFTSDDGCRLYLDDKLIIDDWNVHSVRTEKNSVTLEKGKKYQLKAEYFDNGGEAIAKLHWRAPSAENQDMLNMYGDASKVIRESDVVIAVMGINQSIEREGQDRTSIELPQDQQIFIREAYKANPNTIVVLVAGSSMAIGWMDQHIPAIIDAWYPGEQGGTAIAEVLFGDYSPAGRLPLTFYNSIEDLPALNDYDVKNNRTYMYFEGKPLYSFGHGLSYTQFDYRNLNIQQENESVTLNFSVKNSGKYNGDEVAQVYVQFPDVGIKTPLKQLKGFKRVHIKKGATQQISIEIPQKELRLWDDQKKQFYTPSGTYNFMVGKSSDNISLQKNVQL